MSAPDPPPAEAGPLLLIDGHSLAFRAFFALPDTIATDEGFPTNALYGLAAMMMKMLTEERPGRVVVCWDAPGPTFRDEIYPEYKAGRAETPDLFREQSRHFRPLMESFGFVNTELAGYEADDLIGTLATRAEAEGEPVLILTGDRDAFQLVSEGVSVLATGRGVTDITRYTPEAVRERYGIGPELMPDFRGMVGDPSDNLPGVPGIGEKGASTLLVKYGSLDNVLRHANDQTPKRREALTAHAEAALATRELASIKRDVPLDLDLDTVPALDFGPARMEALREQFDRLQFQSLLRRLADLADGAMPEARAPAAELVRGVRAVPAVPADLGLRLAGQQRLGLAVSDGAWAVAREGDEVPGGAFDAGVAADLGAALAGHAVACHDAKAVPDALWQAAGAGFPAHDTMVAGYLLEPRRRGYALAELAADARLGVRDLERDDEAEAVPGGEHPAALAAALVRALAGRQAEGLRAAGLERLYHEVELPLVPVLAAMERVGVRLDTDRLAEIRARVADRVEELRGHVYEAAGGEFVIESPKQLGQVLFERLGLPTFRRGKTGYSTDRQVLRLLEDKHPIVGLIGQYRELTKLENTYLAALPELVDPEDGRLHTTFNQTVAETGRLSSVNPNLQNIPIRTALGREIRDAFVADPGCVLISCDYSQVELRILAHVSGEPTLKEAFRRGEDVHRATAAEVFGMAPADVDRQARDRAKAVNFGIVYGISDFGLSEQLGIPRADARAYIDAYLDRYPRVRSFIDTTIAAAAQDGFVTTLFGRRRPIPELGGRTRQQRQLGERLAVNTIIQGTAADVIKLAMVRAHAALAEADVGARLVLQIHDELLVEAPASAAARAGELVRGAMVGAADLDPALAVDVGTGETWLEAK